MTDPEMDATLRLAFWVRGIARERPHGLLLRPSDVEWARMRALSDVVDRRSAWRYSALGGLLTFLILVVGTGAIVAIVALGPWAAVETGVLGPAAPANNIWAVTLICAAFVTAGALVVMALAIMVPPRLAAAWAGREDLRSKLDPQPGDAALLAKCERQLILFIVVGAPGGLVVVSALAWLVWAAAEWLPRTEWLVLLFLVLMTPVIMGPVMRRLRHHRHVS